MDNTREKIVTRIEANPLLVQGKLPEERLNVAAYCRVSTDSDDQLNSYEAQVAYYSDYINKNPKWHFVDIYADEGESGTETSKRKHFNRMIRDCNNGKIDLILTKSVSRFARNTVDSLNYIRKLKEKNIGIFFEEQNCNTLKEDSEMILGIYSVMAQTESENISANVRWGIQKRMRDGTYHTRMNLLGYGKDDNDEVIIIPEEAAIIKRIFSLYLDGYSLKQIAKDLIANGFKTKLGNCNWMDSTVNSILTNEKYVGDILYQKTYTVDCLNHKCKKNNGERTKYLVSNNHPAIISRDTFNAVQLERARRSNKAKKSDKTITPQGRYCGKYAFSELLICSDCGSHLKRRIKSNGDERTVYWRCINRTENGKSACPYSKGLKETDLQEAVCRCFKKVCSGETNGISIIRDNLKYVFCDDSDSLDVFAIEQSIKEIQADADRVMMLSISSGNNQDKYEEEITKMYDQIKVLRERLTEAKDCADVVIGHENTEQIEKELFSISGFNEFDERIVRKCISCIKVNSDSSITVIFKTGETVTENLKLSA